MTSVALTPNVLSDYDGTVSLYGHCFFLDFDWETGHHIADLVDRDTDAPIDEMIRRLTIMFNNAEFAARQHGQDERMDRWVQEGRDIARGALWDEIPDEYYDSAIWRDDAARIADEMPCWFNESARDEVIDYLTQQMADSHVTHAKHLVEQTVMDYYTERPWLDPRRFG